MERETLGTLRIWLPFAFALILGGLPAVVNGFNGCASCSAPNPFDPVMFFVQIMMYGLLVWILISPKSARPAGRSLYEALQLHVLRIFVLHRGEQV
jgi:hypothetical protein